MMLLAEQALNGLQYGMMLFLMSAGLTLVFGVMGLINLAHGSLYMVGAFACAVVAAWTGSFWLGLVASLVAAAAALRGSMSDGSGGLLIIWSAILKHCGEFYRASAYRNRG